MLVLGRKPGERIFVGDNIVITLVRVDNRTARIGIDAPDEIKIVREELLDRDKTKKPRKPRK